MVFKMTGYEKAVGFFKTKSAMAKALGVTPMAVSSWGKRGLPLERVLQIEEVTGGVVTKEDMRPDKFRTKSA